jgi:SAM-dependent methyltransferase
MAKQGEIDYIKNIGKEAATHAANKPFSCSDCHRYLFEIGALMALLPPPPATLLDMGCGTGWTSLFFAKNGYSVTGTDISPEMIEFANLNKKNSGVQNVTFLVSDYEQDPFDNAFDCVVFFDSLHHAEDEEVALSMSYRALKSGGVFVASEPGKGHESAQESKEHMEKYGVTEKDMPPEKIISIGRKLGFGRFEVYPHGFDLCNIFFSEPSKAFCQEQAVETTMHRVKDLLTVIQHTGIIKMKKL